VRREPSSLETTAHFVVAEALTNVGKYACASRASIGVRVVGGADASAGSGLRGLRRPRQRAARRADRLEPPGRGTRVHARISLN
jgi:signal transduction histidine kinase